MTEPTIRLGRDESAIVGYGSLLSVKSLERTLKRAYDGPFVPCAVEGWRRSWNIAMPNRAFFYIESGEKIYPEKIVYLNVRPQVGSVMNGVLFVVGRDELEAMHEREWIYDHPPINDQLRGVGIEGGDALIYVAKPEYLVQNVSSPRQAAVRASYLKILEDGLTQRDSRFRQDYEATTDPVPRQLVIDDSVD